jgi:hypothetical protein
MPWFTLLIGPDRSCKVDRLDGRTTCYIFRRFDDALRFATTGAPACVVSEIIDYRTWLESQQLNGVTHVIEDSGGLVLLIAIDDLIHSIC